MANTTRRLLVVETSRTLRGALRKLFESHESAANGVLYELDMVDSFSLARRRLSTAASGYDGVVLGWPLRSSATSDEVQLILAEEALSDLFVLVLSHAPDAGARTWVGERPNTGYVGWETSADIVPTVDLAFSEVNAFVPVGEVQLKSTRSLKFLLVDDSASSRVFFRRLLGSRGYDVDTAATVTEAREKISKRRFDIAILDYYLPETRGDEFVRELKRDPVTRDITCAVITGAYSDQIIRQCLAAGAVECLFKNEAGELFLSQIDAIARTVRDSRALYEKEQLLDGILDSVGEGVYGVDDNNRVTFMNAEGLRLLEFEDEAEVVGIDAEELFYAHDPAASDASIAFVRAAYAARGFLRPVAKTMRSRTGGRVDVTASVYPLRVRDQEVGTVVAFREVSRDRGLERQAWWHASHDAETGVLNRRYFEVQLESELQQLRRNDASHALMMVALHEIEPAPQLEGDGRISSPVSESVLELVKTVAVLLEDRARSSDLVAYFGQGRFALLLRDADPGFVSSIQANYSSFLENQIAKGSKDVTASVGIASLDQKIGSSNEIIALASLAQRIASRRGLPGIRFAMASDLSDEQKAQAREELEPD